MTARRKGRELALQVLFQKEFARELEIYEALSLFRQSFEAEEAAFDYAEAILSGIQNNREEIDQLISSQSQQWSIDRMSLVDVSILRMGVFELRFMNGEIPPKVAINEALEICKKYSSRESSSFVNGILDQLAIGT